MSKKTTHVIPRWIMIYGFLVLFLVPLIMGLLLIFSTESVPFFEVGADDATSQYAIRNFAGALVSLFALYRYSRSMIMVMFAQRVLIDLPDILLLFPDRGSIVDVLTTIVLFTGPCIWAARTLWTLQQNDKAIE